jgi:hypothetical protein
LQDSQKIPWKRIAVEGAAVVVSILIAFWIDAWWQERSERVDLVEYLVHFESEVIANDELIDAHLRGIAGDLVALHKVFLAISDSDQQGLAESFNVDLGNALWVLSPTISMNAYHDLANSGNLRFVSNTQLRKLINEYRKSADYQGTAYAFANSLYLDHILPAIGSNTALSSLGWQDYDNHLAPDGENTGVTPDAPFSTNAAGLKSQVVWNALFSWKASKIDESGGLKDMKGLGLNLRDLLRAEIEYQSQ